MQGEFHYTKPRKYIMSAKRESFYKDASDIGCTPSETTDGDYVGYFNLTHQIHRKQERRGFEFTIMVLGESGLGKSTFINNLFLSDIYGPDYEPPSRRIKKTVQVEETRVLLIEKGIKLYLTVVDVPGFGDSLNNSGCWLPVLKFLDDRHQEYLDAETAYNRGLIVDNRVHCCLYFISPWGYGLKPLDIQVMKILHERVNIIPVVGKADIFTQEECAKFKEAVMNQLQENEIKIYDFPLYGTGDEISLNNLLPFAVMGSLIPLDPDGIKGRERSYPWGNAEVENPNHCDFVAIRNLLVRSHMPCMRDATKYVYENFRFKILSEVEAKRAEEEKRAHQLKLQQLSEEMESVFQRKIGEKLKKLKELETELEQANRQMEESLKQERMDLENERAAYEKKKVEEP